jgi:GAF domain-containing protein
MDTMELRREAILRNGSASEDRAETDQEKLQFLYDVSHILRKQQPVKQSLEEILDRIFDLLKRTDRGAVILVDSGTTRIIEVVTKSREAADENTVGYSRRIVKRVIQKGNPIVVSNVRTAQDEELIDTLEVLKIESVLCVPIFSKSQVLGAIYVDSRQRPHGFRENDLYLFMDLSQRIALAIENERFSSEIGRIADNLLVVDD